MRLSLLRVTPHQELASKFEAGKLSRFEYKLSDYLKGEICWPTYRAADVVRLREKLSLTQEALAELLRVSPKTITHWESDLENGIPASACVSLCVLEKLGDGVFDLMDKDSLKFVLARAPQGDEPLTAELSDSVPCSLQARHRASPPPEQFDAAGVKDLREYLHLTRRAFADLLGVTRSTVDKWESGSIVPKGPALKILKLLWREGISPLTLL